MYDYYNTQQEEPHAKYFRSANVNDPDFEAKKRKIFKALFQIKKELQKKKEQKVQAVTQILRTDSGINERQKLDDGAMMYHDEEDFFNNVYFNHKRMQNTRKLQPLQIAKSLDKVSNPTRKLSNLDGTNNSGDITALLGGSIGKNSNQGGNDGGRSQSLLAKNLTVNIYNQQKKIFRLNLQNNQGGSKAGEVNGQVSSSSLAKSNQESSKSLLQVAGGDGTQQQWEDYFNYYMEDTQKKTNEYLVLDEFNKLQFQHGEIPTLIVDFIEYITGTKGLYVKALSQILVNQQSGVSKGKKEIAQTTSSDRSGQHLNRYDSTVALTSSQYLDDDNASQYKSTLNLHGVPGQLKAPPQAPSNIQSGKNLLQLPHDYERQLLKVRLSLKYPEYQQLQTAFLTLAGYQVPPQLVGFTGAPSAQIPLSVHIMLVQWLNYLTAEKPGFIEWCSISEQQILENFHRVFGGFSSPIVAKLIYIFLAKGMDCVQIDFLRFAQAFHPLMAEYSEVRGEVIFKILDVDGDGKLNILNIIQIHHNLTKKSPSGKRSLLAIEMKRLFNEYMDRNVHMKQGFRNQITLNNTTFLKIVPSSCLVDEIRLRFYGAYATTQTIFGGEYFSPFDSVKLKLLYG